MNFTSNVPAGTEVASVFPFKSSSSPGTIYECRLYKNGATSCQCPGWTRRVDSNGNRECKHTKEVDAKKGTILAALSGVSMATQNVISTSGSAMTYANVSPMGRSTTAKKSTHAPETPKPIRRFDLDA